MTKEKKQKEFQDKLTTLKEFSSKLEAAERIEIQQVMEQMVETYPDQLFKCIDRGKEKIKDRDFYVCSALKREPLTPKVFKQQFFFTIECPRPYVNFTVYKYHRNADNLELLWCIPDRVTVNHYYNNRTLASPGDFQLLKYCIEYKDGTLYRKMQELNKESPDKPSLIVHDPSIFHAA